MALCNDPQALVAVAVACANDQPRRHRKMLELWVSELEPELEYDAVFAAGHSRSTVHWSGPNGTYSFRQPGPFKSGRMRVAGA